MPRADKKFLTNKGRMFMQASMYIDELDLDLGDNAVEVTYNPYKYDSFVDKATESPIYSMEVAKLTQNKVIAYE